MIPLPGAGGQYALFNRSELLCRRAEPSFGNHIESHAVWSVIHLNNGRIITQTVKKANLVKALLSLSSTLEL